MWAASPLVEVIWKWFIGEWKWFLDFIYDIGADLEGVEPCSKEEDE